MEIIKKIVNDLTLYWKKEKDCASRFAVRSSVYDELNYQDPKWMLKLDADSRRKIVDEITTRIMKKIR